LFHHQTLLPLPVPLLFSFGRAERGCRFRQPTLNEWQIIQQRQRRQASGLAVPGLCTRFCQHLYGSLAPAYVICAPIQLSKLQGMFSTLPLEHEPILPADRLHVNPAFWDLLHRNCRLGD
jgi:hypothetical protein